MLLECVSSLPLVKSSEEAPMWQWKPRAIGADAAPAGPNGIIEACSLNDAEYCVGMCSVHIQRRVQQLKHKYFVTKDEKGELKYPGVCCLKS